VGNGAAGDMEDDPIKFNKNELIGWFKIYNAT
jgi:hypothetical protein